MTIEIQVLAWNRHTTNVTGLNLVNGIPTLFLLLVLQRQYTGKHIINLNDNTQVNK